MDYKKLQEKIDAIWKNESIEEAQSPAQKAAFQKMLDAKNGKTEAVEEVEEEAVEEAVETTTTPERYGQDFFRSVLDELDQNDATEAEEATVSEATQGPGVDAVMELIDMGVSKEDLFDQMMRDHSDDELMSFADDYRRTNDLLGNEGDDSIDIDPDQDDSNVFQQSNY